MLSDLVIETATIKVGAATFTVGGVSFDMVAKLVTAGQMVELQQAVDGLGEMYEASKLGDKVDVHSTIGGLITQLPDLAAKVICLAAENNLDQLQKVKKLSITTQLEALLAIGRLTFGEGDDAIKNFVSGLMTVMKSAKILPEIIQQQAAKAIGTSN